MMERRLVLFLVLAVAIMVGYTAVMEHFYPTPHRPRRVARMPEKAEKAPPAEEAEKPAEQPAEEKKPAEQPPEKPAETAEKPAAEIKAAPEPEAPEQWATLGSADPDDPYRMLVTVTSKGAASSGSN